MKPSRLTYHAPGSVDEAVALLAEHGDDAKPLAGGQSLVPLLSFRLAAPAHLVDVGGLDELRLTGAVNGHLEVGAVVRQADAEDDAELARDCPLLAAALPHVAHREIRNAGTVGGSIAHADPAAELPAVALALDAVLVARGPNGEREIEAADFFRGFLETALAPDELLVRVLLPRAGAGTGAALHELARRAGDFAVAGAAVQMRLREDTVEEARVGYLGVDAVPVRGRAAEAALVGRAPDDAAIAEAARAGAADLAPRDDVHATGAQRRAAAEVLTRRALADAVQRAREGAAR